MRAQRRIERRFDSFGCSNYFAQNDFPEASSKTLSGGQNEIHYNHRSLGLDPYAPCVHAIRGHAFCFTFESESDDALFELGYSGD